MILVIIPQTVQNLLLREDSRGKSTIFIANEQINQYKFLHKSQKKRSFCAATSFAAALLSVSSKSLSKRLGNFPSAKSGNPEDFCFSCGYCGAGRQ